MDLAGARRWQTLREAARLTEDVANWVERRRNVDLDVSGYRGRYETPLTAISTEVLGAAERIRSLAAGDAAAPRPQGEVCRDFNLHDQRLVWIRYAWGYFRDKLDQRDDDTLKPVLEAADEVSWTTYSGFFRAANMQPVPAAPIPYIEYDYVPSALRTGQGHILNRKPGVDAGPLQKYFAALPVPLLRLPPSVITAPWSLLLICHEIGHLLQEYAAPDFAFFTQFAGTVSSVVAAAGGTDDDCKQWSRWAPEMFADLCLASVAGPWAVWAVAPWILTSENAMREPLDNYPPPLTRLLLLDAFAQAAGLPASRDVFARLKIDVASVPFVADVAKIAQQSFTVNGKNATLPNFFGSSRNALIETGRVRQWSDALLVAGDPVAQNDSTAARDAAVAATRAHFMVLAAEGDLTALGQRAVALMRESFRSGVRAGTAAIKPRESLSDALFDLTDDEILASV